MTHAGLFRLVRRACHRAVFAADFRFCPGAVAVHIHSFSAATLRDPLADWAGPLLWRGAAATLGNVYEPYLDSHAATRRLHDRLRAGSPLPRAVTFASARSRG